jgi:hypothetical protein
MQNFDRLWREAQSTVPRYGSRKHHLNGHLAKFIIQTIQYLFVMFLLQLLTCTMEQVLKKNTLMKLLHMTLIY